MCHPHPTQLPEDRPACAQAAAAVFGAARWEGLDDLLLHAALGAEGARVAQLLHEEEWEEELQVLPAVRQACKAAVVQETAGPRTAGAIAHRMLRPWMPLPVRIAALCMRGLDNLRVTLMLIYSVKAYSLCSQHGGLLWPRAWLLLCIKSPVQMAVCTQAFTLPSSVWLQGQRMLCNDTQSQVPPHAGVVAVPWASAEQWLHEH